MAKKRVFLDECCGELGACFPAKAHIFTAKHLGVSGKEDPTVIDKAVTKKCLIITVNKDFVDYYRDHVWRKGKRGTFFFGLIFMKPSQTLSRTEQLNKALAAIEWNDTRRHDDLILVSAEGKTKHVRLCHPECAEAFPPEQQVWA